MPSTDAGSAHETPHSISHSRSSNRQAVIQYHRAHLNVPLMRIQDAVVVASFKLTYRSETTSPILCPASTHQLAEYSRTPLLACSADAEKTPAVKEIQICICRISERLAALYTSPTYSSRRAFHSFADVRMLIVDEVSAIPMFMDQIVEGLGARNAILFVDQCYL